MTSRAKQRLKFDVGSSKLTPDDEAQLKALADTAAGLKRVHLPSKWWGYTDSTGSPEMNTKLSADRSKSVIVWLMQQGGIPVRHIVGPGAMGEHGASAPNETKAGRAENRRVEVKILVNMGMAIRAWRVSRWLARRKTPSAPGWPICAAPQRHSGADPIVGGA